MLYACNQKFDVTGNLEIFCEVNLCKTSTSPIYPEQEYSFCTYEYSSFGTITRDIAVQTN